MTSKIDKIFDDSISVISESKKISIEIQKAVDLINKCYKKGGKVVVLSKDLQIVETIVVETNLRKLATRGLLLSFARRTWERKISLSFEFSASVVAASSPSTLLLLLSSFVVEVFPRINNTRRSTHSRAETSVVMK